MIIAECINCGACEPECPNKAVYGGAEDWKYSEGTSLTGAVELKNGVLVNAEETQEAVSDEYYLIAPDKCTECIGFHEAPQCAAVCPVDCCVPDDASIETAEELLVKQKFLHN
jgi:ferredoxin